MALRVRSFPIGDENKRERERNRSHLDISGRYPTLCKQTGQVLFLRKKEAKESRALTTCASPLRLRSGQSRGPRADHRQDDASEGSPTLISSLGRKEGGGPVMQMQVPAVGLELRPPASPRGAAPTGGRRGRARRLLALP